MYKKVFLSKLQNDKKVGGYFFFFLYELYGIPAIINDKKIHNKFNLIKNSKQDINI